MAKKVQDAKNNDIFDLMALEQSIDTTFGRSSTPQTASYSVKFQIVSGPTGLCLNASYQAVVNFGTEREMIVVKRGYSDESKTIIANELKAVKANYKDICGKTLTTKEESSSDNLEILTGSTFNPKRTAYYRRRSLFSLT